MNCKQGDLAYAVVPGRPADGMIVRCEEYLGLIEIATPFGFEVEHCWRLERPIPSFSGELTDVAQDKVLRPIRDPGDNATDETLEWLPVPTKEGQPA